MSKKGKIILNITGYLLTGGVIGIIGYHMTKALKSETSQHKTFRGYYNLTNQWLRNKQDSKDLLQELAKNQYKKIAIYGMGTLGELLYNDLKKSDMEVIYFIDRNAEEVFYGIDNIPVIGLKHISTQQKADVIIVTPIHDFEKIQNDLCELRCETDIISLEDLVFGL